MRKDDIDDNFEGFEPVVINDADYVERQPITPEDHEIVDGVRTALIEDGENPNEWGNGLGHENLNYQSPFTPEEEADMRDVIRNAEAALEFLPEGAPIPYDIGSAGMLFDEEPPDTEAYLADCYNCNKTFEAGPDNRGPKPICSECIDIMAEALDAERAHDASPAAEPASLPPATPERPRSALFEMAADISRINAYAVTGDERYKKPVDEVETPWVPDAGGNGLDALPMFKPAIIEYGKTLTKDEILRITNEFRDALAQGSQLEDELNALAAKPEAELTAEDMQRAGEIRKVYKAKRVDTEHRRKFLGNKALRTTQLINSCANVGKRYCETNEEKAEAIEKLEERREAARRKELAAERYGELAPYVESVMPFDLGSMNGEQYNILLTGSKAAHAQRQQEIRDREAAEADRQRREIAEREAAQKKLVRVNKLSTIGFQFSPEGDGYTFDELRLRIWTYEIEDWSDDAFASWFAGTSDAVAKYLNETSKQAATDRENARIAQEQLDKIEADKAEEERKAREAAMAPDRDKLLALASEIEAIGQAEFITTDERARNFEGLARTELLLISQGLQRQAEGL